MSNSGSENSEIKQIFEYFKAGDKVGFGNTAERI